MIIRRLIRWISVQTITRILLHLWLIATLILFPGLLTISGNTAHAAYHHEGTLAPSGAVQETAQGQDTNTISGQALLFNAVGSQNSGVADVDVTAYDAAGAVVGSAITTSADGSYTMEVSGSAPYRVEFSGWPSYLTPGVTSANIDGGATSSLGPRVQFVLNTPANNINFALMDPARYCQANPLMITPCYVNGDPLAGGEAGDSDVLVAFPYNVEGKTPTPMHVSIGEEMGSVWGLVFQRTTNMLYAAAIAKRHTGFGPLGIGGIYQVDMADPNNPTTTSFVDLATIGVGVGSDPRQDGDLPARASEPNADPAAFDAPGKLGLADIEISDDDESLWVISLDDRTLNEIFIGVPATVPTAADVTKHAIPDPGCANGDYRPWGLKLYQGIAYIGVVCSAETSQQASDLHAYILAHNPAGSDANFETILDFPLNYDRGYASSRSDTDRVSALWRPWIDEWSDINDPLPDQGPYEQTIYPQPILSDIDFDDSGAMILGFMDRMGNQTGNLNYSTEPGDTETYEGVSAGDILRACLVNDEYVLEINAECGGIITEGTDGSPGQGPGDGEYYWQDMYRLESDPGEGIHNEIVIGGLTLLPGTGEVVANVFDPLSTYNSGGVIWLDNSDGSRRRSYQVFDRNAGGGSTTFGKAAGLGEIELLCDPAPIELGNRVWYDANDNGIQDPGESGIANVRVRLYRPGFGPDGIAGNDDDNDDLAVAVTGPDGEYYFIDRPNPDPEDRDPLGVVNATVSPILANTSYEIRLDHDGNYETGEVLDGLQLTGQDNPQNSTGGSDLNDSDAEWVTDPVGSDPGDYPVISFQTGRAGESNHTLDFGFVASVSIGNEVWYDTDNDGFVDSNEVGISGVTVELFRDINGNGSLDADEQTAIATQQTNSRGFYLFTTDDNDVLLTPGYYMVGIAPANFAAGGKLQGYHSSAVYMTLAGTLDEAATAAANGDIDNDDNGSTQRTGFYAGGVLSSVAALLGGEPINELPGNDQSAPLGKTPNQNDRAPDGQSNLTVDFGFYTLALGDRIFLDPENNGLRDFGTVTINDVPIRLYTGDGITEIPMGPDSMFGTADDNDGPVLSANLGDLDGQYILSGLPEGEYVVCITPPADRLTATGGGVDRVTGPYEPAPDPDDMNAAGKIINNDDNGSLLNTGPCSGTIASQPVSLTPADSRLPNASDIRRSLGSTLNRTVDFGLIPSIDLTKYSLGNRVWFDMGDGLSTNNGTLDNDESGAPGMTVRLYSDDDGDNVPDTATAIFATTTDLSGYYRFDNLNAGIYIVEVVSPIGFGSSTAGEEPDPDADEDLNDNGVNELATVVRSNNVIIGNVDGSATEPQSEADVATDGQGSPDGRGNMTVDFGYILTNPLSLGNQVFNDANNNGLFDQASEAGIADVKVNLYLDLNNDGTVDSNERGAALAMQNTDANGLYLFTNLAPSTYLVELDPTNFDPGGPLDGFISSSGTPGSLSGPYEPSANTPLNDDNDDVGTQSVNSGTGGVVVRSGSVDLASGTQPLNESPNNDPDTLDPDSNLTVDFGVYQPYALGNRVWFDQNDNGLIDPNEQGIADIEVALYTVAVGQISATPIATMTTDALGYYRFSDLAAGDYVVQVAVPDGLGSAYFFDEDLEAIKMTSSTNIASSIDPNGDLDSDDNGVFLLDTTGFVSTEVFTIGDADGNNTEPAAETDINPSNRPRTLDERTNLTIDFGFYEPVALGSRTFEDWSNLGTRYSGQRNGFDGVTVYLYQDANADGQPDGPALGEQVTINFGDYFFFNLRPGTYMVEIDPPEGYVSSTGQQGSLTEGPFEGENVPDPNNNVNNDDNGVTQPDGRIFSPPITLTSRSENTIGRQADPNSNNTLDFAIFRPLSLGNLVWNDLNNNGLFDTDEPTIDGVIVNLYWDANDDGVLNGAELSTVIVSTTTADGGRYLFTGLGRGNYIVGLDASNFQAGGTLENFASSVAASQGTFGPYEPGPDPDSDSGPGGNPIDNDDNGIVVGTGGSRMIRSAQVSLSADTEPTNEEIDNDPNTPDANENLTVDFGVFIPYSLGNRVWHDSNNNGQIDENEAGVANVQVSLYLSGTSVITGTALDTTFTDVNGYYRFDRLSAGDYVVAVISDNFTDTTTFGGALIGYGSSTPDEADPNSDVDSTDNGLGGLPATGQGVLSQNVTLGQGPSEPASEADLPANNPSQGTNDQHANMTVDFGFIQPASVGNFVWLDSNTDGIQDSNETGVSGVLVRLCRITSNGQIIEEDILDFSGNVVSLQTTDENGQYLFTNLVPGEYAVCFTPPADLGLTAPDQQSLDEQDSDVALDTSRTDVFTLGSGEANLSLDAGLVVPTALDTVDEPNWFDETEYRLFIPFVGGE
ncbi:MAG: SdrD B-like domain-containing protein [Chloroflexota bacterium]